MLLAVFRWKMICTHLETLKIGFLNNFKYCCLCGWITQTLFFPGNVGIYFHASVQISDIPLNQSATPFICKKH